ncbi:hypothetical protein QR98_0061690 [Sarcoptes scabiei]|uniref:Uncharacterized protein n=1 Tax=Sarcoptes scabiei TaxID=52283 RepID=A0A132AB32_SARSC|nr:hypothetical protein QR98_0061690 [Sarcoptes scabiei]
MDRQSMRQTDSSERFESILKDDSGDDDIGSKRSERFEIGVDMVDDDIDEVSEQFDEDELRARYGDDRLLSSYSDTIFRPPSSEDFFCFRCCLISSRHRSIPNEMKR